MKTLYLDCFSGISGDMLLGALIDVGADQNEIRRRLGTLSCAREFELIAEKCTKFGLTGTDVTVRIADEHTHENGYGRSHSHDHRLGYTAIKAVIEGGSIGQKPRVLALKVLGRLARAEAAVHGTDIEHIHFHEVGAVDTIVDICGCAIAIELLEIERVIVSPINLGGGVVTFSHGTHGVPVPAVCQLMKGVPTYGDLPQRGELTTPTGAALAVTLARQFGPIPPSSIVEVGYGFGKRKTGTNALKALLLEGECEENRIAMLYANIDDMTPEALAYAQNALRIGGALDVYSIPANMKKGRQGWVVCVMSRIEKQRALEDILLKETSTLGVRSSFMNRRELERKMIDIDTEYGPISVKYAPGMSAKAKPEFEQVATAAKEHDIPFTMVWNHVMSRFNYQEQ